MVRREDMNGGPGWHVTHGECVETMRLMPAGSVDAVVTDPPYGIGGGVFRTSRGVVESLPSWDVADHAWVGRAAPLLRDGGHLVAFCDHREIDALWRACEAAALKPRCPLLYVKNAVPPNPRRCFQSAWESAVWATKGSDYEWNGGGLTPNVYFGEIVKHDRLHPTQKDVGVMAWLLRTLGVKGGSECLDPFMGSGTTGVACIEEGVRFHGIEREAEYVEIAVARLEAASRQGRLFTGEAP